MPLNEAADRSEVRVLDPAVEPEIVRRIDAAKKAGDTLGGEVEVVARGVVVGLGSHVGWDRKLDGRLAGMLMSIPAVKGVEIGMGFEAARRPGSEVHDPIEAGARGGGAPAADPPRRVPARQQQRRRARGRDHHRRAGGCSGGDEADLHPDVPAADRGSRHGRAGQRGERAVRRDRGARAWA